MAVLFALALMAGTALQTARAFIVGTVREERDALSVLATHPNNQQRGRDVARRTELAQRVDLIGWALLTLCAWRIALPTILS